MLWVEFLFPLVFPGVPIISVVGVMYHAVVSKVIFPTEIVIRVWNTHRFGCPGFVGFAHGFILVHF